MSEAHLGREPFSDLAALTQRLVTASSQVHFACDPPTQPWSTIHVNDIDLDDDFCQADAYTARTDDALFSGLPTTEAMEEETADDDAPEEEAAGDGAMDDKAKGAKDNRTSPKHGFVWPSGTFHESRSIDGRPSCAASIRCHLPLALNSTLCLIHTERALAALRLVKLPQRPRL